MNQQLTTNPLGDGEWKAQEEELWGRYLDAMQPLFFPETPTAPDIMQLFSALLRAGGMEDGGWDPYGESELVLNDLFALMQTPLPENKFKDAERTVWRLGLLFYNHVVEMNAPYEVLTNLLRYRLKKGYAINPYYDFLDNNERKRAAKVGLFPKQKIRIIKTLSEEAELPLGNLFDEFFDNDLRNAISHSDFIITDEEFRIRGQRVGSSKKYSLNDLSQLIRKSKIFIGSFFHLEKQARTSFGKMAGRGYGYDPVYKGIMEVLVDAKGLMNGFKVHWPNSSDSFYQRTPDGIDMTNCMLSAKQPAIELFVGIYAQKKGHFSPLVEDGGEPVYTPLENGDELTWRD